MRARLCDALPALFATGAVQGKYMSRVSLILLLCNACVFASKPNQGQHTNKQTNKAKTKQTSKQASKHACMHEWMCVHTWTHAHINTCKHADMRTCTPANVHTCTHAHMHAHKHTYVWHTDKQANKQTNKQTNRRPCMHTTIAHVRRYHGIYTYHEYIEVQLCIKYHHHIINISYTPYMKYHDCQKRCIYIYIYIYVPVPNYHTYTYIYYV